MKTKISPIERQYIDGISQSYLEKIAGDKLENLSDKDFCQFAITMSKALRTIKTYWKMGKSDDYNPLTWGMN